MQLEKVCIRHLNNIYTNNSILRHTCPGCISHTYTKKLHDISIAFDRSQEKRFVKG